LPKKVSDSEKKEILDSFSKGFPIKELSEKYNYSIQTITRQLKLILGDAEYKKIKLTAQSQTSNSNFKKKINEENLSSKVSNNYQNLSNKKGSIFQEEVNNFFEIVPLTEGIELNKQKDISSIPISEFDLPKVVYLLVDNKIELDPKLLKDYPEWDFLPKEDLIRNTIQIFADKKNAQLNCRNNQKLIKVPNPDVFFMASKFLKAKGISRIIFQNYLLSL